MFVPNKQCTGSIKLIFITLSFFICVNLVLTSGYDDEYNKQDEEQMPTYHNNEYGNTEILSRKRRYLTFPSGSSFQLVYDLIIGVVDYTNYLILGVTSALAWQLPSDAPSEIVQHLKDKLNDGTLGISRNDTIENIQYIDTKQKQQKYPQKSSYITTYSNPSLLKPQSSSYFASNQFHPPMHTKYYNSGPIYYTKPPQASGNVLSRKYNNIANNYSIRRNPLTEWKYGKMRKVSPSSSSSFFHPSKWSQWWKNSGKRTSSYGKPVYARQHRVYPVFAKRGVDKHNRQKRHGIDGPSLTKIDKIHLRYHRSTRQELYLKIEKYLGTHKKNGHECVLKALCETGQKGNEEEPGTFVGEIMRSIFTMPESEDPVYSQKHKLYDEAHAHVGNCIERFPLCPDSLWKADFIF
ncbi:uncharacterized protein LOC129916573 [Episyrphus balteatus]|uniref:uncharacterized protein LOC129916573 n=1 Tax=Episyrphus balteatus TaxID=286459 RepID=UPI0024852D3E|nr:uncharacterized protein LOC129916573 [Episyrphus balteatus]